MQKQIKEERDFIRERDTYTSGQQEDIHSYQIEQGRSDLIRWQQDFKEEIEQLKHDLRNEYYDFKNNDWVRRIVEYAVEDERGNISIEEKKLPPLINEYGLQMIEVQLRPFLSRNLFNSNLSENRILDMLRRTAKAILYNLVDNITDYEIEFRNIDQILRLIMNVMIPSPYRALHGWGKKMDTGQIKRVEAYSETAIPKKRGWFS